VGDAASIEERIHGLLAGRRRKAPRKPEAESPREIERRAQEQLYGERSKTVVRSEQRPKQDGS